MRVQAVKSKNTTNYYIIRYSRKDGKDSTEIVEKLGNTEFIQKTYDIDDAMTWAKQHVKELNEQEKNKNHKELISFDPNVLINSELKNCFNVGYLFLQQIYYQLKLPNICKSITKTHSFEYNLDSILSRLIYDRILFPSSKRSCMELSHTLLEQPDFSLHQIYKALDVIGDNTDLIQAELYKHSKKLLKRKTGILYYDCTNYYFEIDDEKGSRKYGFSKEHRPNPIVQMGLLMDRTGLPLAFCINDGNTNEQTTLKPLELQIIRELGVNKFIICTDAGLSSYANRKFNNYGERSFITTQSIKKLKSDIKEWALDPHSFHLEGSKETYNLNNLDESINTKNKVFYKQKLIEGYDEERDVEFNQTLIVTYSSKYKEYQRNVRNNQIDRALKFIDKPSKTDHVNQNDFKRFVIKNNITNEGELATKKLYELNQRVIDEEERYDGFYAVCTNLDEDPEEIVKINKGRWEIEESFRIMKSEFKARPVYLQKDNRIRAHFTTCFISLLIYRILENKLENKFTCNTIIDKLRNMKITSISDKGYIPSYTRDNLSDALHEISGFRTDYEITTKRSMKGIIRQTKGLKK
ncbi:MAG: IS1634 family transposase [Lachnospiraceae bacterium]|jgi:transposase|nr:IS1634 family transposase [Lachnospiraceae bacterium]